MARVSGFWKKIGTAIEPAFQGGADLLLRGTNRYLSFGEESGEAGYGIRDNGGVLQYKNSAGVWTNFNAGGGGGGGHVIEDEGTPLIQRSNLNFVGAGVTVTDDSPNDATVVTIPGGGVTDGDKGDITVSNGGLTWTIDNQAVTRQKLEHIQSGHFLARHAASTGDVQEVSPAQARTILQINNVDNTSDLDKPISTATQTALDGKATPTDVSNAITTHVGEFDPHTQYPLITSLSAVAFSGNYNDLSNLPDLTLFDNLESYANLAAFPATGELDKLYIAQDTGELYRWDGTAYVGVSTSHAPVTLAGTPDYITIIGQTITRGLINLASHVTSRLPFANLSTLSAHQVLGRAGSGTGDVAGITMGNDTILGRSGSGNVDALSASQVRTILNVENGAEVNNISDVNATDLTDGGDTTLHHHDSRYYTETETNTLLAGKANTAHTHAISDVTGLQTALDARTIGAATSTDNAIARFDGTTGKVIQDSSVVVNDSGNVGIGTTSPQGSLHVLRSGFSPLILERNENTAFAQGFQFRKGRNGTGVLMNDQLLRLMAFGELNTGSYAPATADQDFISAEATENFTATNQGRQTSFFVVSNGSTIASLAMRLLNNAHVFIPSRLGIGTSTPAERLSVAGNGTFTGTLSASNLSGTNTGDVTVTDTDDIDHTLTGQALSSVLRSSAITAKTTVTPVAGDFVLISDTSDAGNLKKVDASNFLGGGGGGISEELAIAYAVAL